MGTEPQGRAELPQEGQTGTPREGQAGGSQEGQAAGPPEGQANGSPPGPGGGLRLTEPERELVAAEAAHFASRVSDPQARQAYERLQQAASSGGQVDQELVGALEGLLALGLTTGRIRAVYGAHGEMAATAAFQRTPGGRALQRQCEEANQALRTFVGRPLQALSISARGPGLYLLTVEVEGSRAVLQLDKNGVQVRSVEFAL